MSALNLSKTAARRSFFDRPIFYGLLIFAAAALPRAIGFVGSTSIWQIRARAFYDALGRGDWAATLQAPHPGVTTMWLAGFGRWLAMRFIPTYDSSLSVDQITQIELAPIALVIALAIMAAYFLLERLFDRRIALTAGLLLALDPFQISLAKAIHVDGLVTAFMLLATLALWLYFREIGADESAGRRYLIASGVSAGLAVLTKTPAVFLIPYFFLILLARLIRTRHKTGAFPPWGSWLAQTAQAAAIWGGALVVTYVVLWPAMWVQPLTTLSESFGVSLFYRETPHENPIFFLGKATDLDPGVLFYPINVAIKTTAVVLMGFLLSLPILFQANPNDKQNERRAILWLAIAFIFFFTLQMTLGEKKFDRYMLPAMQIMIILAGVGWVAVASRFAGRGRLSQTGVLAAVIGVQLLVSIPRHPYYGTHYSYLFGGPRTILGNEIVAGQEKGEGLVEAAAYLNQIPLSKTMVVGAQNFSAFFPYFEGKSVEMTDDRVDYLVFNRSWLLRGVERYKWAAVWEAYQTRQPKFVAAFDGIPYVWVFKAGPLITDAAIPIKVGALIGPDIELLGYDFSPKEAGPGDTIELTLYWEARADSLASYTVFTHLVDPADTLRGQQDNPPQGGRYPTDLWDAGERVSDSYELTVAPDAPPGRYRFAVGLYDPQTLVRRPVTTAAGEQPADQRLLLDGPQIIPNN